MSLRSILRLVCLALAMVALSGATAPGRAASGAVAADPDVLLEELERTLGELLTPQPYDYLSDGRRDPFVPLIHADGMPTREDLPSVEDLIVVGVLWADTEYLALTETRDGRSLVFRPGDEVRNGKVLDITESGMVVHHSHYGVTRTVTLRIASGEEKRDER
ncbi:MAG: hypothetical protein GF330_14350 [Candidatus Eisenbacteria bacterium]|nr:hypothetical protein [Candidatus Eisenbacteria bacterium]